MTVPYELPTTLVTAVMTAARSGDSARPFLDAQREQYVAVMRELTRARRTATENDRLVFDYQIFHIEADLRWIDHTAARLGQPAPERSL